MLRPVPQTNQRTNRMPPFEEPIRPACERGIHDRCMYFHCDCQCHPSTPKQEPDTKEEVDAIFDEQFSTGDFESVYCKLHGHPASPMEVKRALQQALTKGRQEERKALKQSVEMMTKKTGQHPSYYHALSKVLELLTPTDQPQ